MLPVQYPWCQTLGELFNLSKPQFLCNKRIAGLSIVWRIKRDGRRESAELVLRTERLPVSGSYY